MMEKDIPVCHGEKMQPTERRMEDGRIVITYGCMMRHCSETVDIIEKTSEEEKKIEEALDIFRFMWKRAGEDQ